MDFNRGHALLTAEKIKKFGASCGADVVKIGSMDRWEGAPKQMDARYIFPDAKSIIGLVFRIPRGYLRGIEEGTFFSVYPFMGYAGMNWVHMPIVLREICCFIEDHGYEAVPIPNYDAFAYGGHTDYEADGARSTRLTDYTELRSVERPGFFSRPVAEGLPCPDVVLSYRVAGYICGLGEIGWSKMLLTPEFGPCHRLVFILTEAPLDADPLFEGQLCDRCMLCAKNCSGCAISTRESVKLTVAGREIEHGKLDVVKCSTAYSGGVKAFNPFLPPDADERAFQDEYLSPRLLGPDGALKHIARPFGNNPALEGARGCVRACLIHLEEQGKLTRTFHKPFRRKKPWRLE